MPDLLLLGGASAICLFIAALYVLQRAYAPGRPRKPGRGKPEVALLGDSITQGSISFPWADELSQRFPAIHFSNTGVNGDPSFRVLQRLPGCLVPRPVAAVVLCGTNDAIAMLHENLAGALYEGKLGGVAPSVEAYQRNLRAIVRHVRAAAVDLVAVVSPPPLGDVFTGPPPVHPQHGALTAAPNDVVRRLSDAAQAVALQEGCEFVPLFTELEGCIELSARARVGFDCSNSQLLRSATAALRVAAGGSYDGASICEYTHDAIHLNERGGAILLRLLSPIMERLAQSLPPAAAGLHPPPNT